MTTAATFETWAIVEVMGHRRFAGFVTEQTIGGASFIRVDVPETSDELPAFTKLLGAPSIYAITPCTEETARAYAAHIGERAFATYEAPRLPAPTNPTREYVDHGKYDEYDDVDTDTIEDGLEDDCPV